MKIKLEINIKQLQTINASWERYELTDSMADKATKNILLKVFKILSKKAIDKIDTIKPFKITLEYHEAYELYWMLHGIRGIYEPYSYERNAHALIANQLHQKLA